MKRRIIIWLVSFVTVVLFCRLVCLSFQPAQSHPLAIRNISEPTPMGSPSPVVTGILSNTNFQLVLRALQQRTGVQQLAEPHVTTYYRGVANGATPTIMNLHVKPRVTSYYAGTINRIYYDMTFTLPVTNR